MDQKIAWETPDLSITEIFQFVENIKLSENTPSIIDEVFNTVKEFVVLYYFASIRFKPGGVLRNVRFTRVRYRFKAP